MEINSNWFSRYSYTLLVGGFNPFENISQIGSCPQVGVKIKKYLKPPPSLGPAPTLENHWILNVDKGHMVKE